MTFKKYILFAMLIVLISAKSIAQNSIDSTQMEMKPLDEFLENIQIDTTKYVMSKSPTKAVLLSLILPGMGQLYVESYWKTPIFLGAAGFLTYLIIDNHNQYIKYENEWNTMPDDDPNKDLWYLKKEFYRDNRDQSAFYLLGVYIINAVDAYVGAHLYDFNVDDDLKAQLNFNNGLKFSLIYHW